MVDISPTLIGKSERLNADDLSEEGRIITVTDVRLTNDREQPLAIGYAGDKGRPYYPCVTMRRVIAHLWGTDGSLYKGRQLHLYRDPTVTFGKETVGGIRIKGASHITGAVNCSMTVGRGKKKRITIQPIRGAASQGGEAPTGGAIPPEAQKWADGFIQRIRAAKSGDALERITQEQDVIRARNRLRNEAPSLEEIVSAAITEKLSSFDNEEASSWV